MFFSNLFAIQINIAFEFVDARMQEWVGLYVFILYDFASGVEMSWMCQEQPFEADIVVILYFWFLILFISNPS